MRLVSHPTAAPVLATAPVTAHDRPAVPAVTSVDGFMIASYRQTEETLLSSQTYYTILQHSVAPHWTLMLQFVKGIVHPKMNIHKLSTHHYANGGVGEVFEFTRHFWSFRVQQCSSQIQIEIWLQRCLPLKLQKCSQTLHPPLHWNSDE